MIQGTLEVFLELRGGLHLKPPKFEHIFVAVLTFFPFFCANTFDTSLLLIGPRSFCDPASSQHHNSGGGGGGGGSR